MTDIWKVVLEFYEKELHVPRNITECLSVLEILRGCAMGLSNTRISKGYDDIDYVSAVLFHYYNFPGWDIDLDFSPIAVYRRINGNYLAYEQEILMLSWRYEDFDENIKESFNICKRYEEILKELDEYYG